MRRGQSLVEFALIAPILILLTMAVWDGGSALREQVVLQQAARDGARVGASAYGGAQQSMIQDAVTASAADLPALSSLSGYMTISSTSTSVTVRLQYPHVLVTPVLRQLWGGGQGTLMLSASSTFYVPRLTPVPATIVPSTPIPSATPTSTLAPTPTVTPTSTRQPAATATRTPAAPTPTPTYTVTATPTITPTATPSPTPQLPSPCSAIPNIQPLPAFSNNTGYWCTLRLTSAAFILAYWLDSDDPNDQIQIYANNPFAGLSNPSTLSPPDGAIGTLYRADNGVLWGASVGCVQPGTYTIYFFNRGSSFPASLANVTAYAC